MFKQLKACTSSALMQGNLSFVQKASLRNFFAANHKPASYFLSKRFFSEQKPEPSAKGPNEKPSPAQGSTAEKKKDTKEKIDESKPDEDEEPVGNNFCRIHDRLRIIEKGLINLGAHWNVAIFCSSRLVLCGLCDVQEQGSS